MREIKFRAWHTVNKVMFDHKSIPVLLKNVQDDNVWKYMQYTGICDVNGEKIYEHDYVRFTYSCFDTEMNPINVERVMLVKWMGAGFDLIDKGGCRRLDHSYNLKNQGYGNATFEVIGNIYENPDLLAKTNNV